MSSDEQLKFQLFHKKIKIISSFLNKEGEDEAPGPEIDADEEEEIRARRSPPGGDPVLEES